MASSLTAVLRSSGTTAIVRELARRGKSHRDRHRPGVHCHAMASSEREATTTETKPDARRLLA